jgi:hypothetical protein
VLLSFSTVSRRPFLTTRASSCLAIVAQCWVRPARGSLSCSAWSSGVLAGCTASTIESVLSGFLPRYADALPTCT